MLNKKCKYFIYKYLQNNYLNPNRITKDYSEYCGSLLKWVLTKFGDW